MEKIITVENVRFVLSRAGERVNLSICENPDDLPVRVTMSKQQSDTLGDVFKAIAR